VRVWGFGDVNTIPDSGATDPNKVYFQILNSTGSYINYGSDGLQRLDYVVSSAEKHGVKLVLPFVNNWGDYGGINAYNVAFGGNSTTWFTDVESQTAYKAYIKALVTRYSSSTAIFSWELANEPRCHGCNTSVIYDWASSISSYIKSLDASHLVTLGDEGWLAPQDDIGDGSYAYSGGEGVDFALNLEIPTLDYGVFHLYPDSWGYSYTWGNEWIVQHDLIGKSSGKPVILEEYGAPFPHNHTRVEEPWQTTVLKNTSIAADQIWQFGSPDLSVSPGSLGDVNTIYYNDTEYKILGSGHAAALLAKKAVAS
jgi:mannan endo-1,4-beta-mannosidase